MYDYNRISFEARERARIREHEAARERIARHARARRRARRSRLGDALLHLRRSPRGRLAGQI